MPAPRRVGVIGFGLAGAVFHAPLITTTPGLELSTIVTSDPDRRARAQATYPHAAVVSDVGDLFQGAHRVDVVVVASPNRVHVAQARAALDAGIDVVVDKPLAPTAAEAAALVARAAATGRSLTVFQNRRWDGDFLTVRRLMADGTLGRVHRFESRFDRWRPEPRTNWRESGAPEEAGGLLYDLGSHLIDQALVLFGPVTHVWAEVDVRRRTGAVDDDVFVAMTHANGVHSHMWTTLLAADPGPRFVVRGDRGSYVKRGLDVQEDALKRGLRPVDGTWGAEPQAGWGTLHDGSAGHPFETVRGDYGAFYRQLAAALRGEGALPVDANDAVRTLTVIEAAQRSARETRAIELAG